ncbi:MAG: substrate-binding domain-containing protein, partial [Chloroflexi bacterium]|nr:substrate-binding domain-containing protein [Chloroflexota bacterium]
MKLSHLSRPAAVIAAAALLVAACGDSASTTAPSEGASGEAPYIAIVSKGSQHQFWQAVQKGATDEAAKLGATITYEGPASESEVDKQLTMLQTAIDKNPQAICFAALDSKAATPLLEQAQSKNIP